MPKHLHLSELERLERIARLDADEERQEARDRAAEASDVQPWQSDEYEPPITDRGHRNDWESAVYGERP